MLQGLGLTGIRKVEVERESSYFSNHSHSRERYDRSQSPYHGNHSSRSHIIMTEKVDDRVLIAIISTDQETILLIEVRIGQVIDNLNIDSIIKMSVKALDSTLVLGSTDPIREVFRETSTISYTNRYRCCLE